MTKFLTKTLITSVAVLAAAFLLSGIHIDNTLTAILVAAVLGLLNNFIKPILIILTIPITIFTLGLFLLFINILIIEWATDIVSGFTVDSWFSALLFSLIVSIITSFIERLISSNQPKSNN